MQPRHLTLLLLAALVASCGDDNKTTLPNRAAYKPGAVEPLACLPNLDGQIDEAELPVALDTPVSYLVSPVGEERGVALKGQAGKDGALIWDWSADYASDQVAVLQARSLEGLWFAGSFPEGQFAAPQDLGGANFAVYRRAPEGLYLLGLASAEEAPAEGKTLLVYETPIELFRYPLVAGSSWVSVGQVRNGMIRGLLYAGRDVYEVQVSAQGTLRLPDLTFDGALRVDTKVTVQPAAGQSVVQRQVSFMFECFGEVARATSRRGEEEALFTTATEVRRLGILQ